jgi:hypothetical protein
LQGIININYIVLFECIKLTQSNCDHEGFLKCFIWMQKIYRNLGNLDIARKCLSTCLIKSFKNNNYLIYLISTCELAHLNFVFHTDIGEGEQSNSLEEKILSHSNSYIYAFKNVLQYLGSTKQEAAMLTTSSKDYFKHVYFSLILNFLRKGYNSLAVSYLKIVIDIIGDNNSCETYDVILYLLYEITEYDITFAVEKFYQIIKIYSNDVIAELFTIKLKYLRGDFVEYFEDRDNYKNIYYSVSKRYFSLSSKVAIHAKGNDVDLESELIEFKNFCKSKCLNKFKFLTDVLIAKLYLEENKITESLFILEKTVSKANDFYIKAKAKIVMLQVYSRTSQPQTLNNLITELSGDIETIGSIEDKYDYYLIRSQHGLNSEENKYISKSLKNAILMSNTDKINNALSLYKKSSSHSELTSLNNLLSLYDKFNNLRKSINLSLNEEIEINKIVQYYNKKSLTDIN